MEKILTVENFLGNLYDSVMAELAELADAGEIPEWETDYVDEIENIHPIKDYRVSLHKGQVGNLGDVVARVYIHTLVGKDIAEVTITW